MNTLDLTWPKNRGGQIYYQKVFEYSTLMARVHIRIDACLRFESRSSILTIQLLSSLPPAWLFGPHHSPQCKPVLDKAAVKTWEKPTRKKLG